MGTLSHVLDGMQHEPSTGTVLGDAVCSGSSTPPARSLDDGCLGSGARSASSAILSSEPSKVRCNRMSWDGQRHDTLASFVDSSQSDDDVEWNRTFSTSPSQGAQSRATGNASCVQPTVLVETFSTHNLRCSSLVFLDGE
jgi:hypothetical protein